jgi:hypothetical protein
MRTVRIATGFTVFLLMSGCAAEVTTDVAVPSPTAPSSNEPTSEPTPEPTADLKATSAVIFGTRVEWRNAVGNVIDSIGFDADSTAFVSKATKYFGFADEEHDERGCSYFLYGDDNGLVISHSTGGGVVELYVRSPEVNGVRIETPSGLSVGEDATAFIASIAPELKVDRSEGVPDYPWWGLVYDAVGVWGTQGDREPPKPYGAGATVHEGLLFNIMVPATLNTMHMSC